MPREAGVAACGADNGTRLWLHGAVPGQLRTLVVRRLASAVEWAVDTRRVHGLRILSPGFLSPTPPGPLGPWGGTDDFLGLQRASGRVSMPNCHGPIAVILKGGWCGPEPIHHRRED